MKFCADKLKYGIRQKYCECLCSCTWKELNNLFLAAAKGQASKSQHAATAAIIVSRATTLQHPVHLTTVWLEHWFRHIHKRTDTSSCHLKGLIKLEKHSFEYYAKRKKKTHRSILFLYIRTAKLSSHQFCQNRFHSLLTLYVSMSHVFTVLSKGILEILGCFQLNKCLSTGTAFFGVGETHSVYFPHDATVCM